MRKAMYALSILIAGLLPAGAEWKDMNTQINATNFIIMLRGRPMCSATLISLKYKLLLTAKHCVDFFIDTKTLDEVQDDGSLKKIKRETLEDVPVQQKAYQGYRLVGDSTYQSVIIAHKTKVDMALLQLRADSIPQAVFSQVLPVGKTVERGDRVFVVGNPLGMLDATLTAGIISSTTRMMRTEWADDAEVPFIQHDAAQNGGNSGGALYNADGQLIGIPDAGWRGANGLGLALTPDSVRDFLKASCFADVYDETADSHDKCEADKKAEAEKKKKSKSD